MITETNGVATNAIPTSLGWFDIRFSFARFTVAKVAEKTETLFQSANALRASDEPLVS